MKGKKALVIDQQSLEKEWMEARIEVVEELKDVSLVEERVTTKIESILEPRQEQALTELLNI
jgi:hypothetical protein